MEQESSNYDTGKAEEIMQSIPIPEQKMGSIVGKQGSYIHQLSQKSGAQIMISESVSREYGMNWKYVQLKGSGRALDRAKKLLHIRLERLETRGPTANMNFGPQEGIEINSDQSHPTEFKKKPVLSGFNVQHK